MSTRPLSDPRATLVLFALALSAHGRPACADEDPMSPYRERFKAGMDRYTAGDLRGAVDAWEAIYDEVGGARGYRVAFDLGRAYDKLGDLDHAGERYGAFLDAVRDRRASGAPIEPIVAREETDARARYDEITAREGRLRIAGTSRTSPHAPVQIDGLPARDAPFTAFVPPGQHVVTFAPGMATEAKVPVTVQPGQSLDVSAPPAPPPAQASPAPPAPPVPPATLPPSPPPAPAPSASERPFSPVFLLVAGGASVAAITVTIAQYARALSLKSDFDAASASSQGDLKSSYDATRPLAYGALGASIGLTALTGVLCAWYLGAPHGSSPRVVLVPTLGLAQGGAQAGFLARF